MNDTQLIAAQRRLIHDMQFETQELRNIIAELTEKNIFLKKEVAVLRAHEDEKILTILDQRQKIYNYEVELGITEPEVDY